MAETPAGIRVLRDEGVVEVSWSGGGASRFPFRWLRGHCPCAVCVSETTGLRMVGEHDVPDDVRPNGASFVGNYAIKIQWSDGHDTGIYSWDWLERLRRELAAT
jgi:DUF971 family protein